MSTIKNRMPAAGRHTAPRKGTLLRAGILAIAAVYVLALLKIVMFKSGAGSPEFRQIQYIPFSFVGDFFAAHTTLDVLLKNVLGNFAVFLPLGILLPCLLPKLTFAKTVLAGFLTSLAFEVLQYMTGLGMTDVDDLILNTLGTLAGAALYFGVFRRCRTRLHTNLAVFLFLGVFGCCGVLSLWLFAPSVLPAQIERVNAEALNGTDPNSYDFCAVCTKIENGTAYLDAATAKNSEGTTEAAAQYPLAPGALLIVETRTYQYSPNGNIQKQTITYAAASEAEAAAALAAPNHCFQESFWLNEKGECRMLLVTLSEN